MDDKTRSSKGSAAARLADRYSGLVQKVDAWIEGQPPTSLHVSDACFALGVSLRTLQRAFQKSVGMGPAQYLLVKRLNKARAALLAADPDSVNVTAIATGHGFWELGQFAKRYRQAFGEHPSQTLWQRHGR